MAHSTSQPKPKIKENKIADLLEKETQDSFSSKFGKGGGFTVCGTVSPHLIEAATSYEATHFLFSSRIKRKKLGTPSENITTGETSQPITSWTILTFINRQLSTIDHFHQ